MSKLDKLTSSSSMSKGKPEQKEYSSHTMSYHIPNGCTDHNCCLLWLDDDNSSSHSRNSIRELRQIVSNIHTFSNVDKCVHFINSITDEKVIIISSGMLGEVIVPLVHDKLQINTIYIFCQNKSRNERWAKRWPKVDGVFTDLMSICNALKQSVEDHDQSLIPISIVPITDGISNKNLDELNKSFMYTQILKEIILTIGFERKHRQEFFSYYREQYAENKDELKNIKEIERDYCQYPATRWYSYESFLYSRINTALRLMTVDEIIRAGFFVQDLHNHITELHFKQYDSMRCRPNPFTVYRYQKLSHVDFDQLMKSEGGLFAFNNFLSTSTKREQSLKFSRRSKKTSDTTCILFVMTIDHSKSTTPFADISEDSDYEDEREILFSMHSIFRIGQIKQIEQENPLCEVKLTLTSDNDPQLSTLTERLREETKGSTGWLRLGTLMVKLAQYKQANDLYQQLLNQSVSDDDKGNIFYHLGLVNYYQGDYAKAITFHKKSLVIRQKILPTQDAHLADSYNDIGLVYNKMGQHAKALSYYQKALDIRQRLFPRNHPDIAESYNNIGSIYDDIDDHPTALYYYEKALKIYRKTLPPDHIHVATAHNNIGLVQSKMGDSSKALHFLEAAQEKFQKTLPPDHPDLAASFNNIAIVYTKMGDYSKALSYYERSGAILKQKSPSTNHNLAAYYINIGEVYDKENRHSEALKSHEEALKILQTILPADHADIACCYGHIGIVLSKMGNYSKAIRNCEQALEIAQRVLPRDSPQCQSYRRNLETIKKKL